MLSRMPARVTETPKKRRTSSREENILGNGSSWAGLLPKQNKSKTERKEVYSDLFLERGVLRGLDVTECF